MSAGRDVNERLKGSRPASKEEVAAFAVKVHACLEQYPPHMRDPFKMFGVMDDDGSGRIMFNELESFVRVTLKLGRKA